MKIDRSFVDDITTDADAAAIVRAIIALGHNLNLAIVAEGVETAAQLEFLRAERCDAIQGFLMSPAVPAQTLAQMIRARARSLAVQAAPKPSRLPHRLTPYQRHAASVARPVIASAGWSGWERGLLLVLPF